MWRAGAAGGVLTVGFGVTGEAAAGGGVKTSRLVEFSVLLP